MTSHLKEIANISFLNNNGLANHCLTSDNHLEVCINNRSAAEVVNIRFDNSDEESLNILTSINFPSTLKPTQNLCPDPKSMYNASKVWQKELLTLDPLLLPELSVDNEIWFVRTELSPYIGVNASYLAALTNFGHCVIKRKNLNNRKWTETFADLTDLWKSHLQLNLQPNVDSDHCDFEKYVNKTHEIEITAFCWVNNSTCTTSFSIVCATAAGQCVFFNIALQYDGNSKTTISHVADLEQTARINHIKWINIGQDSFVCTSNVLGHVQLYRVILNPSTNHIECVQLSATIIEWQMICNIDWLELEYDNNTKRLIAFICIGSRVAIAFIPVDNLKSFEIIFHSFQEAYITGISKISPLDYGLCTMCGSVQIIRIDASNRTLAVEMVSTNINIEKYKMMGISVSSNQSLWLFAIYPRQPFDHLVVRYPVQISFCSQSSLELWSILEKNQHVDVDCLEALRVYQIRYDDVLEFNNLAAVLAINLNDNALVHELRLRLALLNACCSYVRRKSNVNQLQAMLDEALFISSTILAISFYRRLENTSISSTSPPRLVLSSKNILQYLSRYVAEKSHPNYCRLTSNICAQLSMAVQLQEVNISDTPTTDTEYCHHCDNSLDYGSKECTSGHKTSRCCLTYLQLPVISNRSCLQCGARALNLEHIFDIFQEDDNEKMCPVCNVHMVTSQYV